MKKFVLCSLLLAGSVSIFSCKSGSSFEDDVRKMAKLGCERERLNKLVMEGDSTALKKLNDVEKEGDEFVKKMEEKYKGKENDKAMNQKAEKIKAEEMAKCK